eukprot:COSAG02_NODE_6626_length_3452_cov_12.607998_3_plen_182_part_00
MPISPPCEILAGDFPGFWQEGAGIVAWRQTGPARHPVMQAENVKSEPSIAQQFTMHPVAFPRNYSVRFYICGPFAWGGPFLSFVAATSVLYIGGGVVYGRRLGRAGASSALAPHPHYQDWQAVAELCRDGIAYSRGQLLGGSQGPGIADRRDRLLPQHETRSKENRDKEKVKGKNKRSSRG